MDFSWKSTILHAVYARASAAMPVACTAQQYIHSIWVLVLTHYLCEIAARTMSHMYGVVRKFNHSMFFI